MLVARYRLTQMVKGKDSETKGGSHYLMDTLSFVTLGLPLFSSSQSKFLVMQGVKLQVGLRK